MSIARSTFAVTMRDRLAQVAYPPKPPGITLTIDNGDGSGHIDYTAAIDRETKLRLHRRLNAPSQFECCLRLGDPALVVPPAGAKIRMTRLDGTMLFTGSTESDPGYEFLGWAQSGPVYRLSLRALSDDAALDERAVPIARVFHDVSAGAVLKQITADVAGGEIDVTNVAVLDKVHNFEVERRRPWSEQAASLAARTRGAYRVEDGKLWLEPIGARSHHVDETDPAFEPETLKLRCLAPRANDITVIGDAEPDAYVKEYFVGDASRATFALSRRPLTHPQRVFLKDDFAALDPLKWAIVDPAGALSCDAAHLAIGGGTGNPGETAMSAVTRLQLSGGLILQHGHVMFTGDCDGVIGGLYAGEVTQADCLAGFLLTTSAGQVSISALLQGGIAGEPFTVASGHSYLLRTRLYCAEHTRARQIWHSSANPAGEAQGGEEIPAALRVVLELADTDLSQPAAPPQWTVLHEQLVDDAPAFAAYALVNAASMHAQISCTRLWHAPEIELTRAPAGEPPHMAMLGTVSEGGSAVLAPGAVVRFHDAATPALEEQITVRYRASRTAIARVTNCDDTIPRALVCRITSPQPGSSRDCALAAEVLLGDLSQPRLGGEYSAWRSAVDLDMRPGDAVHLDAPSRGVDVHAVIREVWLEPEDIAAARWRVRIRFANDAAEPIAIQIASATRDPEPLEAVEAGAPAATIAALPAAEVTSFGVGIIGVDAGQEPIEGGGFEARSDDANWGSDGAGLIGRFATREFVLDRTSRPADYYLRAFDASAPPRYSDVSTMLHVDYPL